MYIGGLAFVNQSVTLIARGGSENPRLPRQPAYECLTLKNELQLYQLLISSIKKSIIHYSRKKIRLIQAAYVHSLHRCSSSSYPSLLGVLSSTPPSISGRTCEKMKWSIATLTGLNLWNKRYVLALVAWPPIQKNFGQ